MSSTSTTKYLALLIALLLVASCGGVFAVWTFAENPAESKSDSVGISINEYNFVWTPEEILPTDKPGENYITLLGSILDNSKVGLNSSKDVIFDTAERYGIVHCDQNVQGGNLKHLNDVFTSSDQDLDFVISYVSETELHCFMFEDDDVNSGLVDVTPIKVYKTILRYAGGEWYGEESQLGYATIRYLPSSNHIGVLPNEWVRGALPT